MSKKPDLLEAAEDTERWLLEYECSANMITSLPERDRLRAAIAAERERREAVEALLKLSKLVNGWLIPAHASGVDYPENGSEIVLAFRGAIRELDPDYHSLDGDKVEDAALARLRELS